MRLTLIAALLCSTIACGDNVVNAYQREAPLVDSFETAVRALQQSPRRPACEQHLTASQLLVAKDIDRKRDVIERYVRERGQKSSVSPGPRVQLGPLWLVEPIFRSDSSSNVSWVRGWGEVIDYHAFMHGSADLERWALLYSFTMGLLVDDAQRHGGLSMGMSQRGLIHARVLGKALETCVANSDCLMPELPPETERFSRVENSVYGEHLRLIAGTKLRALKRQRLRDFAKQVELDTSFYGFTVNDTVTVKDGVLTLPLQVGDLAGSEALLAQIIESVWRSSRVSVKVRWVSTNECPGAYRFVAHTDSGNGRAFVSHSDRTINLYPEVTRKTIAHELGHVIGLADRYYTKWVDAHCAYEMSSDTADIMSDHESGQVTPEAWAEIREHYDF